MFIYYGFNSVSYLYNERSDSVVFDAELLPNSQEIFINKKVKYGNIDPIDLMAYVEDLDDKFTVREIETQWNRRVQTFKDKIYFETVQKH